MAYTETTTTSYGGRLGNALKGIVGGFIAFIAGTALLIWNEGNFVKTKKALNEAAGNTVIVESVDSLDPELNGKLIHASAMAKTDDILEDSLFDVKENAVALKRKVEYYQFEEQSKTETRDKLGGGEEKITTYTYKKGWQSRKINSSDFKDPEYQSSNFVFYDVEAQTEYAKNVSFGAYTLPDFFIESISGDEKVEINLPEARIKNFNDTISAHPRARLPQDASDELPQYVHVSGDTVYFGRNPSAPSIGDVRVTISKVLPKQVSLIGKVNNGTFGRYVAKNGKRIARLEVGEVSAEEMFANAQSENVMMTWLLRIVGIMLVCGGLRGIFGILEAIAKVLPFLGNVVGAGVGLVSTVLGLAWSFLWIAIAWVAYRPLIGIPMLLAAGALIFWLKTKGQSKSQPAQPAKA